MNESVDRHLRRQEGQSKVALEDLAQSRERHYYDLGEIQKQVAYHQELIRAYKAARQVIKEGE